jgi:energy-coupling factor transporter ATP-binding protein EcfA2
MALAHVNLTIAPGTICAILGPTNSGKTTLLQAIAGALGSHHHDALASGTIAVGNDVFSPLPDNVLFPTVGLTLQDPYYQLSGLRDTVAEEISLTLESLGIPDTEIEYRTAESLASLGLTHLAHRKPSTLSGGELQRVVLANILVARPPILLLDEPANSLDGIAQRRLASIICALKGSTTVVVADYQLELAMMVADQFVVMDGGRIVFTGDRNHFVDNIPSFQSLLPVEMLGEALRIMSASTLQSKIMKLVKRQ